MTDTKYNGWTNYETWLTNLHFDGFDFTDDVEEGNLDFMDRDEIKEYIASYIETTVEECTYERIELGTTDNLFIADMIQSFLGEVDWDDIADHYCDDVYQMMQERANADN
jgi:glutamate racemase